jgi:periplasmic protein TonB
MRFPTDYFSCETGATAMRPFWLRPLALSVVAGLHALLLLPHRMKLEAVSPIDAIEVTLAPRGDDSAENQQKVDEILAAEPASPTQAQPQTEPAPLSEPPPPPEVPAPDAIPLPAKEARPADEPKQATDQEDRERERRAEAREARRKEREIADRRRQAQQARQAERRGSSSNQSAGGYSRANYAGLLMTELNHHRFYPAEVRAAGVTGSVGVAFTIGPSGRVVNQSITHSSGVAALDAAARLILAAIHAPPPPNGSFFASTSIRFHLN